jgi:flavin reductase (DIM6/NTAB) family NADH-FMN oxidoreductase RutF
MNFALQNQRPTLAPVNMPLAEETEKSPLAGIKNHDMNKIVEPAPPDPLDPVIRKKVLRMIPYGMFVITSRHDKEVGAATIDWVTQSSFDPPMVVCCLRKDSFIYQLTTKSGRYAIHPMAEGQKPFAAHFFKNRGFGDDQINGQSYLNGQTGVPILAEAPASMELLLVDQLTQGDHCVVLGKIVAVQLKKEIAPLLLRDTGWHYGG